MWVIISSMTVQAMIAQRRPILWSYGSVQLPGELAASVYQMMQEDKWTIFWHPTRLTDLTTSEIQSVICAALNSRRRLLFVIGVASNSKAYNMLLRRKTEINRVSKNQPNKMRIIPCLRESGTVDSSLLKRVFLFGFPGFVIGLLAYDYLPKMLRK
uniref:TIR domain-containing protein n=1 Tax=Angiostrongylus cantonensis TaxID=6313 RepID=A0A0K0CWU8_ANGCA